MANVSEDQWRLFMASHPEAHLLQSGEWGRLKSHFGWQAETLIKGEVGAQVLFRRLPLNFSFGYIPKGPVGGDLTSLVDELDLICQKKKAIFLMVEPDVWRENSTKPEDLPAGFRRSTRAIQPARTILVDIGGKEDEILSRMKQKTRYNIRLAQKKGVVVKETHDIEEFYRLMTETGERDQFGVHSQAYYQEAYTLFRATGECVILTAYVGELPVAAVMVFSRGARAWYFYGASAAEYRSWMPAYLVQWEAILWAKRRGCVVYDLWGVPDEEENHLETNFAARSDGLWGVYRFKRGFGGVLQKAQGPWERVYNPILYWVIKKWIARND